MQIWTLFCCYLGYRYLGFGAKKKRQITHYKKKTKKQTKGKAKCMARTTSLAMGQGKGSAVWVVQLSLHATKCVSLFVFWTSSMHLLVEFCNGESMFFLIFLSYPAK